MIRQLKFNADHESVVVALENGDTLQGSLGPVALTLQTLVGEVRIPLEQKLEIRVSPGLAGGAVNAGLIAYFPFDGDAEDLSGNGHTGTVVETGFQVDESIGRSALQVNGTGASYVRVTRSADLEPPDGITISMWVKGQPGQAVGYPTAGQRRDFDRNR